MKYVFPAIFRPQEENIKGYHIFFPDIKGAGTVGDDLLDGIEMGADWLCSKLYEMEQNMEIIPNPTPINKIKRETDDIVNLISVDTAYYQRYYENQSVEKSRKMAVLLK